MKREYVKGCYLLTGEPQGDSKALVVWYDGATWWLPGWECGMCAGPYHSGYSIAEQDIGELLWAAPS